VSIDLVLLWQSFAGMLLAAALFLVARRRQYVSAWTALFLAAVLVVAAPLRWDPPVAPAQRVLRILSVLDLPTTTALVRNFERRTGIVCEVDPFAGGARGAAELLMEGRIHPDVMLGGTSEIHDLLRSAGVSARLSPRADPARITRFDDPDGYYVPVYLGYLALVVRSRPEFEQHAPDWNTLLDPRWTGRVRLPSPASTSGGLVFVATQILRQPEAERGWNYLSMLNEREVLWESRSEEVISQVADGRAELGVSWAHDIWRRRQSERKPISVVIPKQTGFEVGAVSVLRWAREPEAAGEFVDFLISRDAQVLQVQHGLRIPIRTDVDGPPYLDAADAPTPSALDFYDRAVVLSERDRWLERWAAIVQQDVAGPR
jgi:iron(III) transport system substrate-binding protein